MVAKRNAAGQTSRSARRRRAPAPGAEWGDEKEFERYWRKSLDEVVEEFRREDATSPPRRALTEAEFLASLEERP